VYFLLKTAVDQRQSLKRSLKLLVFLTSQTTLKPFMSQRGRALAFHLLCCEAGESQEKPVYPRIFFCWYEKTGTFSIKWSKGVASYFKTWINMDSEWFTWGKCDILYKQLKNVTNLDWSITLTSYISVSFFQHTFWCSFVHFVL